MAWGTIALWSVLAPVLGGGASAATQMYGSRQARGVTDRAATASERSTSEALQFERDEADKARAERAENEKRRRQEWDRVMTMQQQQWEALDAEKEPYRQASRAALSDLMQRAGYGPMSYTPPPKKPDFAKPMPDDWQPGDPTGIDITGGEATGETTSAHASPLLPRDSPFFRSREDRPMPRSVDEAPITSAERPTRTTGAEISEVAYTPLAARETVPLGTLMRRPPQPRRTV